MAAGVGTWDAVRGAAREQRDLDVLRAQDAPPNAIWIDSLDLSKEVNQDVLGRGGSRVRQDQRLEVRVKLLADRTKAVALFNRGLQRASATASWADIGVTVAQPVRDLWQQRDFGTFSNQFTATVPAHGAVLVKVGRPGR